MPKYNKKIVTDWKIAKKLYFSPASSKEKVRPAVRIAMIGMMIGVMVMLISVCVVVGFKQQISEKVAGFGSHIQLVNFDNNSTYEMQPIRYTDSLQTLLRAIPHVQSVSVFATKPGIIKVDSAFQGVVFKGTDYWDYFASNIEEGQMPSQTGDVLISRSTSHALGIETGDNILCYFVENSLRVRRLYVAGIYNTCMTEMDKLFVVGHIDVVRQLNHWDSDQASGIEILVDDLHHLDMVADAVYQQTANRLDADGNAFYVQTLRQLQPQIFGWLDLLDLNVVIILILMLCVSGFSIITGLIILIMNSVHFIGVMKALGADNAMVRRIFVFESSWLVGKGMVWGNIIGLSICALQYFTHLLPLDPATYYVSYVPIAFPVGWLILLNVGTLVLSMVILLAPSAIATRISPVKVMQFE